MTAPAFTGPDRFELIRCVGAGGMGEVWEVRDRERNARVALKSLIRATPERVLRLKQEFRLAQRIAHENVVSLGELIHHEGAWFLTMELVDGVPLLDHVRPGDKLDLGRLRDALRQLVAAVDAIHAAGVVHRDLKPSNVMVSHEGRLVVLDLGLLASNDDANLERDVVGTAAYMAPEQAAGRDIGPAADWYGVGAILYHALSGAPPFEGDELAILGRKQRALPAPIADRDIPADLGLLTMSLLAIEPRDRPDPLAVLGGARRDRTASKWFERSGPFVGREPELAILQRCLTASSRQLQCALVTGESGVGKTALVRQLAARARAECDAIVLYARSHEREAVPGAGIDGLMDAIAAHLRELDDAAIATILPARIDALVRAFPVLRTVPTLQRTRRFDDHVADHHTRRARVAAAIREMLARIGDRRRLIVVLDDLQWADAETAALLENICEGHDAPCMLLVATWRASEETASPPGLFAGARTLHLDPLPSAEASELARALLTRVGKDVTDATALARESGGHPLLLDVLVDHHSRGDSPMTSASLHDAMCARIVELGPDPRRVLDALAIAGAAVGEGELSRVTSIPAVRVARATATLRTARLVRQASNDALEIYHHQILVAVLGLLESSARQRLHASFADALEASGTGDPELLAMHLEAAGDREAAARYAVSAAREAVHAAAFHRAARLWGRAIALGGAGDADACHLGRAEALAAIGRGADAAADFLHAAQRREPVAAIDLRRQAAQQLLVTGHTAEGLDQIREILSAEGLSYPSSSRRAVAAIAWRRLRLALDPGRFRERDLGDVSPRTLARVDVCWHVALGLSIVDTMRGHAFHALGLRLARQAGEPRRYARALALDIAYRGTAGGTVTRTVEEQYRVARALADAIDDPHARGLAIGCRGVAAFLRGDWRSGASWCEESERIFAERCTGVPWELATSKLFASRSLLALGELRRLSERTDADIRDCRDRGDLYGETSLRGAVLPFVHLFRDDEKGAAEAADSALSRWTPVGYQIQHYYQLVSRCSVRLYVGTPDAIDQADALLREGRAAARRAMFVRVQVVRASIADLEGRIALAQPTPNLPRAAEAARRLRQEKLPWTDALAVALDAGVAGRRGQSESARELLSTAIAGFDACDMQLHAATARRRLALLEGASDAPSSTVRWMSEQGVAAPERLMRLFHPW